MIKSDSLKIISSVSQGPIIEPILFKFSIIDLFFFVSRVSMYNFSDDNTLSASAKTAVNLKNTLQSESEVIINWFKNNKMRVNPEKFQAIISDKQNHFYSEIIQPLRNTYSGEGRRGGDWILLWSIMEIMGRGRGLKWYRGKFHMIHHGAVVAFCTWLCAYLCRKWYFFALAKQLKECNAW